MSFILDALKKSESDRQQQSGAEFSSVPAGSREAHPYKWLWILALLLAVNFAALMIVLMRPGAAPDEPAGHLETPAGNTANSALRAAGPSFEEQVAKAQESHEARAQNDAATAETQAEEPAPVRSVPQRQAPAAQQVPSIDELRLDGSLQLPELHLDIHVASENADERFVFINMTKYREGSRLDEGPLVSEITPEGVILDYQGRTFLLPRE